MLQEVIARYPGCYLKAYVEMRDAFETALPVDAADTEAKEALAHHLLQAPLSRFGKLDTARGETRECVEP